MLGASAPGSPISLQADHRASHPAPCEPPGHGDVARWGQRRAGGGPRGQVDACPGGFGTHPGAPIRLGRSQPR